MSLTVREKEHWKERIGRKINIAIEQLKLSDDASDELTRIENEAVKQAEASLGLADLLERFREVVERKQELTERLESVTFEIHQKLGSTNAGRAYIGHDVSHWVQAKIDRRAKLHRLSLLKECEIGRKLLRLEREKEELLDTVWLSTSTKQIKQLWSDVAEMLKVEQTELQKQAIGMEPVEPDAK